MLPSKLIEFRNLFFTDTTFFTYKHNESEPKYVFTQKYYNENKHSF